MMGAMEIPFRGLDGSWKLEAADWHILSKLIIAFLRVLES